MLKALAFGDRGEPKDAYDLVYVIRHTPRRGRAIAERLATHAERHASIVQRALRLLVRDFDGPDGLGPTRAAGFAIAEPAAPGELDEAAADAQGYVDDILRAAGGLRLAAEDQA